MKVQDIMTTPAQACQPGTTLREAAMTMWQHDCGSLPVVDAGSGRVTGVITDRDICMALATTGSRPDDRTAGDVARRPAVTVAAGQDIGDALAVMAGERVRRLPVVGGRGELVGVLSLNDVVRHAAIGRRTAKRIAGPEVLKTLAAICEHPERTPAQAGEVEAEPAQV